MFTISFPSSRAQSKVPEKHEFSAPVKIATEIKEIWLYPLSGFLLPEKLILLIWLDLRCSKKVFEKMFINM
jgi:hypothetical protein